MKGREALATLVAVATVSAGCSRDAAVVPIGEAFDSAGIRIVTYDLTDIAVAPYASVGEYDLEIGAFMGVADYSFSRIIDLRISHDGSIVVADGGGSELRVYDENGAHVRTLGRKGGGPGEFSTAPLIAGLAGDTVFAWDGRDRRVTSFSGGGEAIETTTLQAESVGPLQVLRLDDGTYLAQSRWVAPGAVFGPHDARVDLDSVMIEHIDANGALIDTVRVLADMERVRMRQNRGGGIFAMQMAPRPLTFRAFMLSDGVRPIIGHNGSFELISYDRGGGPQVILRVEGAWPAMTAEEIRSRVEAQLVEAFEEREIDPRTRRLYEDFMPQRMPDFKGVVISSTRDIWVEQNVFDRSDGLEWLVFSAAGELRGSVRTPPGLQVFDIEVDYLVGVVLDELEVPYVRRYPLTLSGEGEGR